MHNIIIISGPSGCGKSTMIHKLLAKYPELNFSVSHTTRPPRSVEIHGLDYYFVSQAVFVKMKKKSEFAEWAEVHGHYYGTSRREILKKSTKNRTLVLDLDVQGARNIKRQFPEAMTIFVIPPSLHELKKRLRNREKNWNQDIALRLQTALDELNEHELYEYVIVNRDLGQAFSELCCLYVAFCLQMNRHEDKIKKLIRGQK
ncbi:MAG: guanylate kinase [Candidatus Aminicenantes bacterium]|nr:guanylate kinase [Candidatus Aminicenantes bacterium]